MRENEAFRAAGWSGERLKVLIGDDSEAVRARIGEQLLSMGAEIVAEAVDGVDVVEKTRAFSPDLVVLDVRMPRMSGLEALPRIKSHDPAPVVVVITNYAYSAYRSRCIQLGADHFIDKSTEFERLDDIVADLVSAKAMRGSTPALSDEGAIR